MGMLPESATGSRAGAARLRERTPGNGAKSEGSPNRRDFLHGCAATTPLPRATFAAVPDAAMRRRMEDYWDALEA
jgi:hypothetical protein